MEIKNTLDRKFFSKINILCIFVATALGTIFNYLKIAGTEYALYLLGLAFVYELFIIYMLFTTKTEILNNLDKNIWKFSLHNIEPAEIKAFLFSNLVFSFIVLGGIFIDTVLYFLNIAMFENIYIIFVVFHTFDLLNQIKVKNLLNK